MFHLGKGLSLFKSMLIFVIDLEGYEWTAREHGKVLLSLIYRNFVIPVLRH